jgi:hypothetical protein
MRIAGHGDSDILAGQEVIERGEAFRGFGDIMPFGSQGNIMTAGEARMAHDCHGELAAASAERPLDPCPLSFVDRA